MTSIQERVEGVLASAEPDVEVLLAEVVGGRLVRLFIDHPDGVTLDLCERVTRHLPEVRVERVVASVLQDSGAGRRRAVPNRRVPQAVPAGYGATRQSRSAASPQSAADARTGEAA